MRHLIKNFAISLQKSIAQIVGLVAALLILIGLFTGFWIDMQFGLSQIQEIEGNYVDSMIVTPDFSSLNGNLWSHVSFDNKTENVHDFYRQATVKIAKHGAEYELILYNGQDALLGQETNNDSQYKGTTYFFVNPMNNLVHDQYYYDFDRLIAALPKDAEGNGILHLLPTLSDTDGDSIVSRLATDLNQQEKNSYQLLFAGVDSHPLAGTSDDDYFAKLYDLSKQILWLAILGMNSSNYHYANYFSYKDPRNQTSVQIFPDSGSVDLPSFSDPIFTGDLVHKPLAKGQVYIVHNFADNGNIQIGDEYTIMNERYNVVDYAVNAIYNSNAVGAFKYNSAFWMNDAEYQKMSVKASSMTGYAKNSDMYFDAGKLSYLNDQLFHGENAIIDVKNDALGDVYYTNHLLSLFLQTQSKSGLSNFYYKVPVPHHQDDESMGVHRQLAMINERNTILISVLLVASAVLELASIVMVVVVIAHLIKHNEKSIGVLKANGLNAFQIAFAISICFFIVLIFTGLLAVIFSALMGYILNLTYSGFTQMTSYSFVFVWYIAIIDFLLPIVLIIPFVAIFALVMLRKSPLVLIKGAGDKRIKLISFKSHLDPFKYISRIPISFKQKLSFKFAFSARGKLVLTVIITLISTIGLYIVFNLMQTNSNMIGGINDQFIANSIYGYNYQHPTGLKGRQFQGTKDPNYSFFDETSVKKAADNDSVSSAWPIYHHATINDANKVSHRINQITSEDVDLQMDLKDKWVLASDLMKWRNSPGWKLLPEALRDVYDTNSEQISVLAQNKGIITFGFEPYNAKTDQLLLTKSTNIYQLLNKQAKNILLFNNSGSNSGWIDNDLVQKLMNKKEVLKMRGAQLISASAYDDRTTKLRLADDHYDVNRFLTAPIAVDQMVDGKVDLSSQIKLADGNKAIVSSLDLIRDQLIGQWKKMGINHFNVIPIMVNAYYKMSDICNKGDILFSNRSSDGGLDVYVIYDWLRTLNTQFMVVPYSALYQNIYNNKMLADGFVYNWKLTPEVDLELNHQISIVSPNNNYNISFYSKNNDFQVNLNFMMIKAMLLQGVHDANASLLMIIQAIGVLTVILTIVQVTVTMNIILKSNINTINLLKAFGYSKLWIFNRLFMIYIPLIILSGILAFPFGYLVSYYTYLIVIRSARIFTPFTINLPIVLILIVVMLFLYALILVIVMWYNNKRHPVYRFIT